MFNVSKCLSISLNTVSKAPNFLTREVFQKIIQTAGKERAQTGWAIATGKCFEKNAPYQLDKRLDLSSILVVFIVAYSFQL